MLKTCGAFAVVAILAVFVVLLFPAHAGAFGASHVLATAFRSRAAAQALFTAMSAAPLISLFRGGLLAQDVQDWALLLTVEPGLLMLRC